MGVSLPFVVALAAFGIHNLRKRLHLEGDDS